MASCKMQTRKKSKCSVFGCPKDLNERMLPTYEDVMKCYLHIRQKIRSVQRKEPVLSEILEQLVPKIEAIWNRASIPIVPKRRIV